MEKHGKRLNRMYTLVRHQSINQQYVMLNNFKGALRKNTTNLEELGKNIPHSFCSFFCIHFVHVYEKSLKHSNFCIIRNSWFSCT